MKIKIEGLKPTSRHMVKLQRDYPRAFNMSMFSEAIQIMNLAGTGVPWKTGRLFRSAFLTKTSRWRALVFNVFAGYSAPYAGLVHSTHRTQAGWLTQAVAARRVVSFKKIAKETHARVKAGNFNPPRHSYRTSTRGG